MGKPAKISRVGFVVAKLLANGQPHFLMRKNRKWHDISFVGGHESRRDAHKLARAAYRELLEEVPSLRRKADFELEPLTDEFCYGPIHSRSAENFVGYELQFFFLRFLTSPKGLIGSLTPRSSNILLPQTELLAPQRYEISGLVPLLERTFPGGLNAIPLSWAEDIGVVSTSCPQLRQIPLPLGS
jgi:hypothetical protein